MSKIAHIAIAEKYTEGLNYNHNTFPAKHVEQGHDVHIITTTLEFKNKGTYFFLACKFLFTFFTINKKPLHPFSLLQLLTEQDDSGNTASGCKGNYLT